MRRGDEFSRATRTDGSDLGNQETEVLPISNSQRHRRAEVSIVDPTSDTCELTSQLTTAINMVPDSTSTGAIFTVQASDNTVEIVTLEFDVDPIDTSDVQVQVFTRIGDFVGFENKANEWTQLANVTITPSLYGLGTLIPISSFQSVTIQPQELRAFYIAIPTPVIQFTKAPSGMSLGQIYQSDSFLSIAVGAELPRHFGADLIEDRIFNGKMHYTVKLTCENAEVPTTVVYAFLLEQPAVDSSLLAQLQTGMETALQSIFQSNPSLQQYTQQDRMTLESVQASPASYNGACPNGWTVCSLVSTVVTLKHLGLLDSGTLIYDMLQNNVTLTNSLQNTLGVTMQYAGNITVSQDFIFTLKGVPANATLDAVQTTYFEQATLQFLQQAELGLSSSIVLDVVVGGQPSSARFLRLMQSSSESTSIMQLSGAVLGMYVPPQTLPYFGDFIQGLFADNEQQYVQFLSYQADGPGSISESGRGTLFAELFGVTTTLSQGTTAGQSSGGGQGVKPVVSSSGSGKSSGDLIRLCFLVFCVVIICIMLLWLIYHFAGGKSPQLRRRKRRTIDVSASSERRRPTSLSKGRSLRDFVRKKSSRLPSKRSCKPEAEGERNSSKAEQEQSNLQEGADNEPISNTEDKANTAGVEKVESYNDLTKMSSIQQLEKASLRALRARERTSSLTSRSSSRENSMKLANIGHVSEAKEGMENAPSISKNDVIRPEAKEKPTSSIEEDKLNITGAKTGAPCKKPINSQSSQGKSTRQITDSNERASTRNAERRPSDGIRAKSLSDGAEMPREKSVTLRRQSSSTSERPSVKAREPNCKPPRTQASEKPISSAAKTDAENIKTISRNVNPISRDDSVEPTSTRTMAETSERQTERQSSRSLRPRVMSDGEQKAGASKPRSSNKVDPVRLQSENERTIEVRGKSREGETLPRRSSNAGSEINRSINESDQDSVRRKSIGDASQVRSDILPPRSANDEKSGSTRPRSRSCDRVFTSLEVKSMKQVAAHSETSSRRETDVESSGSVRRRSMSDVSRERSSSLPPARRRSGDNAPSLRQGERGSDNLEASLQISEGSDGRSRRDINQERSSRSARRMSTSDASRERPGSLPPRSRIHESPGTAARRRSSSFDKAAGGKLLKDETDKNTRSQRKRTSMGLDQRVSPCDAPQQASSDIKPFRSSSDRNTETPHQIEKKMSRPTDPKARLRQNKRARLKRAGLINTK